MLTRADELQRIPINSNVAPCEDGWIRLSPTRPPDLNVEDDDDEDLALNEEIEGRCFNDLIETDVIGDIAGFIVYKLGHDIDDNITVTLWNDIVSEGGLKDPSSTLIEYLQLLNDLFKSHFKVNVPNLLSLLKKESNDELGMIKYFEDKVPALQQDKKLCDKIKDLFFKCIIRGRIRKIKEVSKNKPTQEEKDRAKKAKEIKKHKRYSFYFITYPFIPFPFQDSQFWVIMTPR